MTIILPPAPTVHHSMLAMLCALAGTLTFADTAAQAGSVPEPCPNAQLRTEQPFALALPDCRAYEHGLAGQ